MGKIEKAPHQYKISEIFRSIQCEGFHTGSPAVFIRFSGCDRVCSFCDTDHSCKMKLTAEEIAEEVRKIRRKGDMTVFTGGEPTLQPLYEVMYALRYGSSSIVPCVIDTSDIIAIETNGNRNILKFRKFIDWITISPKDEKIRKNILRAADEIKIVYDGVIDPTKIIHMRSPHPFPAMVNKCCYIQPCSENFQPAIDFVMSHKGWRLSVQIQKAIAMR